MDDILSVALIGLLDIIYTDLGLTFITELYVPIMADCGWIGLLCSCQ